MGQQLQHDRALIFILIYLLYIISVIFWKKLFSYNRKSEMGKHEIFLNYYYI